MNDLVVAMPKKVSSKLFNIYIPHDSSEGSCLELTIKIHDKDINIRDLSQYLKLIDKIYGRFTPKGIMSYSHNLENRLAISELRKGSWEIIIKEFVSTHSYLIITGIAMKYLSIAIKSFKEYEEARLARLRRNELEKKMKRDTELMALEPKEIRLLARILDDLYQKDENLLPGAQRFSLDSVEEIKISHKSPKDKSNK